MSKTKEELIVFDSAQALAEAWTYSYICPLCEYVDPSLDRVTNHLAKAHSIAELEELTGWKIAKAQDKEL